MKLISDFNDWYDYAFDNTGEEFHRMSKTSRTRQQDLEFLKSLGCHIPRYGKVKDLINELFIERWNSWFSTWRLRSKFDICDIDKVVVFTDETAHCGEGKLLLTFNEAIEQYPDNFAVEFFETYETGSFTYRYLQVGKRHWWLRYVSFVDWRSNVGDGSVELLCEEEAGYFEGVKEPLFAVDFMLVPNRGFIAVDYNTAPGLEPIKDKVNGPAVITLIKEAQEAFKL